MPKKALSAKDDKRMICEDGIKTLAIGHWRTKYIMECRHERVEEAEGFVFCTTCGEETCRFFGHF